MMDEVSRKVNLGEASDAAIRKARGQVVRRLNWTLMGIVGGTCASLWLGWRVFVATAIVAAASLLFYIPMFGMLNDEAKRRGFD